VAAEVLVPAAARPDLADQAQALDRLWPTFMLQDPCGRLLEAQIAELLDWTWLITDPEDPTHLLGRLLSVPAWWDDVEALPDRGWDAAILDALSGHASPATLLCLLELTLVPEARGRGLAEACLTRVREIAGERELGAVVAPVRPTGKAASPFEPMQSYVQRCRADGAPADPWLRVHAALGGRMQGIAPLSMVIAGTLAEWELWLDRDVALAEGDRVAIDGGLVPLLVDRDAGVALYAEPNVWIVHEAIRA
jgi:GNAT superfamily N-acetyltransferase